MNDALAFLNVKINGIHAKQIKKPLDLTTTESMFMFIGSYYKQTSDASM